MQNPPPVQTGKSSTGLDENVAALLSYAFGWVSGLIFFLIEKDSRLVRFHAMQSILLNAGPGSRLDCHHDCRVNPGCSFSDIVSGALAGIVSLLSDLLYLRRWFSRHCILWVLCLIKAFQGQMYKLPVVGNFAEKFSAPK